MCVCVFKKCYPCCHSNQENNTCPPWLLPPPTPETAAAFILTNPPHFNLIYVFFKFLVQTPTLSQLPLDCNICLSVAYYVGLSVRLTRIPTFASVRSSVECVFQPRVRSHWTICTKGAFIRPVVLCSEPHVTTPYQGPRTADAAIRHQVVDWVTVLAEARTPWMFLKTKVTSRRTGTK